MAKFRTGGSLPFNVYVVLDEQNPKGDGFVAMAWSKETAEELVDVLNERHAATSSDYFRGMVYVKGQHNARGWN